MASRRGFTLLQLLLVMLLVSVGTGLVVVVTKHAEEIGPCRAGCPNNLSQLYKAMHIYAATFGKNASYMPHAGDAFFTCLLGHGGPDHPPLYAVQAPCFGALELCVCPSSGSDATTVRAGGAMADSRGPKRHVRVPAGCPSALTDGIPATCVIGCDAPGNHKGAGGNVLRFDGSVSYQTDDEFDAAVQATQD